MITDITGKQFGYLTAIKQAGKTKSGSIKWLCKCVCGNEAIVGGWNLRSGHTKSCGCLQKAIVRKNATKHSCSYTSIYDVWVSFRQRCCNPQNPAYQRYGARGVKVCDEWNSFEAFFEWSLKNGYRKGLSLDRIDNNGNYAPNNCRWADFETQANNTSRNIKTKVSGELLTLAQISKKYSLPYKRIASRFYRGDRGNRLIRGDAANA